MPQDKLKIHILAFAGCPNAEIARDNVAVAIAAEGQVADVIHIEVDTPELAVQHEFLGSPSVRVNGNDVEPAARTRTDFGLMCRTYREGAGVTGAPSVDLIRASLRNKSLSW